MSETNSQKAAKSGTTQVAEFREDPRIEIARGGPVSFSQKTLERLGIIGPGQTMSDLKEALSLASGGKHFKGGTLPPAVQVRKDRSILHIQKMDTIRAISEENVDILVEEAQYLQNLAELYPEKANVYRNRIRGLLHYIEMGRNNGRNLSPEAIEDGKFAFQKELESASRENLKNLRTYKEEHTQTISLTDTKKKIEEIFGDD